MKIALVSGPLTDSLISGEVAMAGVEAPDIIAGASVDKNSRLMLDGAFDVAEMSFSTFIKARDLGRDLIGLPIFTGRGFTQPGLVVSVASGITRPEELVGKRAGVPQFWMTSTVWHRLILERYHGVPESAITWYTETGERFAEVPQVPGVSVSPLAEVSLDRALTDGLVDATMVPPRGAPKSVGGPVRWPYPDLKTAERDFFASTALHPIMHFVVMKESVHRKYPALAGQLMRAFAEAHRRAVASHAIDAELWPFGLSENAKVLDAFCSFAVEKQWITPERTADDLFVRT